jgi:signal transduction histidine kinase
MEELTEAFLLLARESEHMLSRDIVCVNDVVREEIDRSELLKQKKDIHVQLVEKEILYTRASDKVLSILFGNLIRNAILYTDEGQVTITLEQNQVSITDSGKGIDQHQLDKIFKPYFRADESDTHGHGVGLTIVKRLSDRFQWPISIHSVPGKGTRVSIQFIPEKLMQKPDTS